MRNAWSHCGLVLAITLMLCSVYHAKYNGQSAWAQSADQNSLSQAEKSKLTLAIAQSQQESLKLIRPAQSEEHFQQAAEKAQSDGALSVIVRLKAAYKPETEFSEMLGVYAQRSVIETTRERVIDNMVGYDPVSIVKFKYIPYIAVTVNSTGVSSLRASSDVLDIEENAKLQISLAESTRFIEADRAWAKGFNGKDQTIAIIDTGVDKSHSFLTGKVVDEACYSANACPGGGSATTANNSGLPCPWVGVGCDHGTHVAGIAAGKDRTRSGVAPEANLIAIQVFELSQSELVCGGWSRTPCIVTNLANVIRGMERVFELRNTYNIAAVNLSLGGGRFNAHCDGTHQAPKDMIDLLKSVNIPTIVSSGNNGFTDSLAAPACISTAISVGNYSTQQLQVNLGSNSASFLNLVAPGTDINSSVTGSGFGLATGTSMSASHVSGAWAILKQKAQDSDVNALLNTLTTTGRGVTDRKNNVTTPLIMVDKALASVPCLPTAPSNLTATRQFVTPSHIVHQLFNVKLKWQDNSKGESDFKIYLRNNNVPNSTRLLATVAANTTEYTDTISLKSGTSFSWYVVASNSCGDSSPTNEWIENGIYEIVREVPIAPSNLNLTTVNSSVILNWKNNSTIQIATRIQKSTDGGISFREFASVGMGVTSYRDPSPRGYVCYRVAAAGLWGNSSPSNAVCTVVFPWFF